MVRLCQCWTLRLRLTIWSWRKMKGLRRDQEPDRERLRRDKGVDSRMKYEEAGEIWEETRKYRKNIWGWVEIERLKSRSRISVLELSQQGQPSKWRWHNMVWAGDDTTQFLFWEMDIMVWNSICWYSAPLWHLERGQGWGKEAGSALDQFSQQ